MPDPQQIVRAFIAHQIDNVPVSRDVACRPFLLAAIPFTIPAEPVPIWLRAPLDQNRRSKTLCVGRPGAKIDIEIPGNNFLKRKGLLRMLLIDIGTQHQTDVWNFLEIADPATHRDWEFSRLKPVIREINPGALLADSLLVTRDIFGRDIVLGWIVLIGPDPAPVESVVKFSGWRRYNAR